MIILFASITSESFFFISFVRHMCSRSTSLNTVDFCCLTLFSFTACASLSCLCLSFMPCVVCLHTRINLLQALLHSLALPLLQRCHHLSPLFLLPHLLPLPNPLSPHFHFHLLLNGFFLSPVLCWFLPSLRMQNHSSIRLLPLPLSPFSLRPTFHFVHLHASLCLLLMASPRHLCSTVHFLRPCAGQIKHSHSWSIFIRFRI